MVLICPRVEDDRSLETTILVQDIALLGLAGLLAYALHVQITPHLPFLRVPVAPRDYVHLVIVFVPAWAWFSERFELHRVRTLTGRALDLLRALLWTQTWGAVAIGVILTLAQVPLNRSLITLFLACSTILLLAGKSAQRAWVRRRRGEALALVVSDGGSREAEAVAEMNHLRGREVETLRGGDAASIRERLRQGGVDEVVVAASLSADRLVAALEACDEVGVPAWVRMSQLTAGPSQPRAEMVGTTVYLTYHRRRTDVVALLLKAVFDRLVAALALVVLAPALLLIALFIKLTSPGPVLFRQQRGGLNGRPFRMLKFRTMREGAERDRESLLALNEMDGPVFKIEQDPRVTPFGWLLRRTSLDELPQLVNVLLGHMSLVGPRPLPVEETRGLHGPYRRRLSVRPGLTCLWQVRGRNDLSFREWMTLDLQYVDSWSLGLDLAILLRTVPALLSGRGAR
jgi:exopolysaccharide biosynthesis polyprenyl glycosylphosphotransferase